MKTVEPSRVSGGTAARPAGSVPRPAISARTTVAKPVPESTLERWGKLLFHSIGVGALALLLLFFAVLVGVGLYGQFVWALTGWDLADVNVHAYRPLAIGLLWLVFAGGTGVGLWFFSGAAWKMIREWGRKKVVVRPRRAAAKR